MATAEITPSAVTIRPGGPSALIGVVITEDVRHMRGRLHDSLAWKWTNVAGRPGETPDAPEILLPGDEVRGYHLAPSSGLVFRRVGESGAAVAPDSLKVAVSIEIEAVGSWKRGTSVRNVWLRDPDGNGIAYVRVSVKRTSTLARLLRGGSDG